MNNMSNDRYQYTNLKPGCLLIANYMIRSLFQFMQYQACDAVIGQIKNYVVENHNLPADRLVNFHYFAGTSKVFNHEFSDSVFHLTQAFIICPDGYPMKRYSLPPSS